VAVGRHGPDEQGGEVEHEGAAVLEWGGVDQGGRVLADPAALSCCCC
jgi:hypothetical protein